MGTIYADPPWQVGGWALPYPTMTVDEISRLPVAELAAPRSHLHMWTGDNFLLSTLSLIGHWWFRFVSSFVWVAAPPTRGNYWRSAHTIMLTAVNSPADTFDDRALGSWISAPRNGHSRKPAEVRRLIERASPGPRLEMSATETSPGWYTWGSTAQLTTPEPIEMAATE